MNDKDEQRKQWCLAASAATKTDMLLAIKDIGKADDETAELGEDEERRIADMTQKTYQARNKKKKTKKDKSDKVDAGKEMKKIHKKLEKGSPRDTARANTYHMDSQE